MLSESHGDCWSLKKSYHGPMIRLTPFLALKILRGFLLSLLTGDSIHFYRLSHSELVDIKKVAVRSNLRLQKPKCTIESRADETSINLVRQYSIYLWKSGDTKSIHSEVGNPASGQRQTKL
ncbi:hypothetical protein Tco_0662549 [Tanacetum coccineum]